jgi:hypothetical protein
VDRYEAMIAAVVVLAATASGWLMAIDHFVWHFGYCGTQRC